MNTKLKTLIQNTIDNNNKRIVIENQRLFNITPELSTLILKNTKCNSLTFTNCKLKTLDNFPTIKALKELNLGDNLLRDESISVLG